MRLLDLKLENFQGIKAAQFDFNGCNAVIYGDNATGKTTVYNAVTWLLFGSSSTGAKGYTPKTKGSNGDTHNLNHTAMAAFELDGGRMLTLGKSFHEVYKKKKGSPVEEFSGHTTDYFVDGVPVKEKEYQAALAEICDAEQLKILTMPNYFSETMTWEARRKLLIEVCGEVDDNEIMATEPELAELKELLRAPGTSGQHYTVDGFRKIAGPQKTRINRELTEIPSRIDEANRSLADIPDITDEQLEADIAREQAELDRLQGVYNDCLQGDDGTAKLVSQLAAEKAKLGEICGNYREAEMRQNSEKRLRVSQLEGKITVINSKLQMSENFKRSKLDELEHLNKKRTELINEYSRIQKKVFDEKSIICPTCGREYPPEQAHEIRERFNTEKSEMLTQLNERGKKTASKNMIADVQAEINTANKEIAEAKIKIESLRQELEQARSELTVLPPVEETEEYKTCKAVIAKLTAAKEDARQNKSETYKSIASNMAAVRKRIDSLKSIRVRKDSAKSILNRIKELEDRESELAREYEQLEKTLYLCDLFTKAKVSRLTDRINDKFKNVSFRLFQTQINGGIKEDCEVLIPTAEGRLVPYTYANNAARINAGLEIINALSEHWGAAIPVFIDNAESVTKLIDTTIQTIRLVVSEEDKTLRLEVED